MTRVRTWTRVQTQVPIFYDLDLTWAFGWMTRDLTWTCALITWTLTIPFLLAVNYEIRNYKLIVW